MLRGNCVLIDSVEGEIERRMKVTIRLGMRYKPILDDDNGKRRYLKFEIGSSKLQFGENWH
jgi:hypothetical protein